VTTGYLGHWRFLEICFQIKTKFMDIIEMKSNIYMIIDKIQDQQFLHAIHDFLLARENDVEGRFWGSLTEDQRKEILTAYEESGSELIEKDELFKKNSS
jgi:hypothetical protein